MQEKRKLEKRKRKQKNKKNYELEKCIRRGGEENDDKMREKIGKLK